MPAVLSKALRSVAPALADAGDARAELLSLIWDTHFDRRQALQLAAGLPGAAAALHAAADRFDAMQRRQQHRLRRLGRVRDNAPCPASC